ncbi:DNA damage-induced apoptosis suppressor protein [Hyla sarda]|uniref:DNA damage-induced apoptosis suppressor protein n=1 Tax=Hyla sarda TaxID=327740 RepID=UPI0024C3ECE2|nr:DNA damage-induced apoptosis suppressor protein [Hyla sarda]
MNGRRRFLVGTVLSIQDNNFIYPACQNCCSRLTQTSCRYECHKCAATYKDASHRYKLRVKVSEENRLCVITIFGKCLEQVFGGSADFLHSQLQVSSQLSRDLEHDRAQELLLQAAEHCLIGRSFIFAVKIPQNFEKSNSPSHRDRNIVACQIILFNEDPMSCTVLSYFNRLVASVLGNNPIHAKTDVSTDTTNRGDLSALEFSERSSGLPQSWNHYAEYWQQSLGLVSSSLSNTLCKYRQGEGNETEQDLCAEDVTSQKTTVSTRRKLNATDTRISTQGVKCSSSGHIHSNTHSPPSSSHFHSFSSKSKLLLGQESYLQNVRKSGSRRSQSCSASSTHLLPQTAEIHQAEEEICEDFPFSESLSEFMAQIEDAEGLRPAEIIEENISHGRDDGRSRNLNIPSQIYIIAKSASRCGLSHPSEDTGLVDRTLDSADLTLGCFQEMRSPFNSLSTCWQERQIPTKVLLNGTYDSLDLTSVMKDLDKSAVASEKVIGGEKNCSDSGAELTSKIKCFGDLYNASADLFEASNNPKDDTLWLQNDGFPNGQLVCLTTSPCTDVLPYQRRKSRSSVSSLSEDCRAWNNLAMEDFVPYLQSTPVLRRLSRSGRLSSDTWNCTGVSVQTRSSSTIRRLFLKNMRQRKSAVIYRLSGNYSLWSPNLSPFSNAEGSTAPFPRTGRKMLSHYPWRKGSVLDNKENYNNQTGHNTNITCTVKETDKGKKEPIEHIAATLDHPKHLSPVNHLLQEGEDGLCSLEDTLLPSDWSPELFSGKSDISHPSDGLQRRLF